MLIWQNFTNTKSPRTILGNTFSKAQMLIWHSFYKAQNAILVNISKSPILFWQLFTKILQILKSPSAILGNTLSKTQILVWQNSTNTKSPSTTLGNILSKAKILVWQNFYKHLKPKYYPWQYFEKILQKSNTILATSYQQPKTTTFFDKIIIS